ncbi:recombinase family protein [Actinokineospora sp. NBRC 105648]|uniref:recombinase family protein n=1 Tax=Actinokineospora sp. NBRC 105648 TaxID=3032206 RepID=UPI0024A06E8C|nr:hypothetical protein Acsp05_13350 [Actinokineospora sp. NBRC 105648]
MPYPLVYGYVRSIADDSEFVHSCRDRLAVWCVREGWNLGAVFTDVGSPLDVENRVGFRGLLDAAAMPAASAVVLLDEGHLSSRADVVDDLKRQLRRTGVAVRVQNARDESLDGDNA